MNRDGTSWVFVRCTCQTIDGFSYPFQSFSSLTFFRKTRAARDGGPRCGSPPVRAPGGSALENGTYPKTFHWKRGLLGGNSVYCFNCPSFLLFCERASRGIQQKRAGPGGENARPKTFFSSRGEGSNIPRTKYSISCNSVKPLLWAAATGSL